MRINLGSNPSSTTKFLIKVQKEFALSVDSIGSLCARLKPEICWRDSNSTDHITKKGCYMYESYNICNDCKWPDPLQRGFCPKCGCVNFSKKIGESSRHGGKITNCLSDNYKISQTIRIIKFTDNTNYMEIY